MPLVWELASAQSLNFLLFWAGGGMGGKRRERPWMLYVYNIVSMAVVGKVGVTLLLCYACKDGGLRAHACNLLGQPGGAAMHPWPPTSRSRPAPVHRAVRAGRLYLPLPAHALAALQVRRYSACGALHAWTLHSLSAPAGQPAW